MSLLLLLRNPPVAYTLTAGAGSLQVDAAPSILNRESAGIGQSGGAAPLPSLGLLLGNTQAYTLPADAGAFALDGVAATFDYYSPQGSSQWPAPLPSLGLLLGAGYTLTADAAAIVVEGEPAGVLVGHRLVADAEAFAVDGQDAAPVAGLLLQAEAGAVDVAGQDAALDYAATPGTYTLAAEAAAFDLVGGVAQFVPVVAGAQTTVGAGAVFWPADAANDEDWTEDDFGALLGAVIARM